MAHCTVHTMSLLSLQVLVACVAVCVSGEAPVVETKDGSVSGLVTPFADVFFGIPYAKPPLSELRWKPPQPAEGWEGVRNGSYRRPACPQFACRAQNPPHVCPSEMSEDCLFLNVFKPAGATNASALPVMVFFHGGNFMFMSGSEPFYDGRFLANTTGTVVVTADYRLGALGFLVTGDSGDDAQGNYGLRDQLMSLTWVHNNIRPFGGDPGRVTIFGQSAGAQSVSTLLTWDEAQPYFHQAIIQSNPFSIPYRTQTEALFIADMFSELIGCADLETRMSCLRDKSASEIAEVQASTRSKVTSLRLLEMFEPWGPSVDGQIVKDQNLNNFRSMKLTKPIIMGTTSEECRVYIYDAWQKPIPLEEALEVIFAVKPNPKDIAEVLGEYSDWLNSTSDERDFMSQLATDLVFICSTRNAMKSHTPLWLYLFDHAFSFDGWGNMTFCNGHVCHGSELPYVFHTATLFGANYTSDEITMSYAMMNYWGNFAWHGDPNDRFDEHPKQALRRRKLANAAGVPFTELPEWPGHYQQSEGPVMHFKTPVSEVVNNWRKPQCDAWDKVGYL